MIAAILRRIPTMVFEPNYVPGLANRLVGGFVDAAAVHFADTAKRLRNAVVTGVPVRPEFFAAGQPLAAPIHILITGGSQGARAINQAVIAALPRLRETFPNLFITHQTGKCDVDEVKAAYANIGIAHEVTTFIQDMPAAFARAHVLICRSGASTVAEIAASGRPAIFVPFPSAADDHQTRNAQAFVDAGAGVLLPQGELTAERLVAALQSIVSDGAQWQKMSAAARTLAHPDATKKIAEMVASLTGS